MRTYEVLFILSPQVPEEEATTLVNDFKGVAEKVGASLKSEEAWGRRRLAYPIEKSNEGNYHLFVFESEGSLAELDRRMKNSDRIIRHMIVRTDLDHKRAEKLARKNPKKERVRPMPASMATAPGSSAPAGDASEAAPATPEAANATSEVTTATPEVTTAAPEVTTTPAAEVTAPAAEDAAAPAAEPAETTATE